MSLIDTLIATFAPYDCLGCGREGNVVCGDCTTSYRRIPERCYRCKKLSAGNRTCISCRNTAKLHTVRAAVVYESLAKDLVWQLKFQGVQAAAKAMAERMVSYIDSENVVIVHVPTASSRVRRRGYDQARLLARAISKHTGLPHRPLLTRMGQHHQVGARREQRVTQLASAFRVSNPKPVDGNHIILIDDVLTTGATLEAAARALKAAGAKRVDGLVFAQA